MEIKERLEQMRSNPQTRKRGQVSKEDVAKARQYQRDFVANSPSFNTGAIADCSETLERFRIQKREAREGREMVWEDHFAAKMNAELVDGSAARVKTLTQQSSMLAQLKTDKDKWNMAIDLRFKEYLHATLSIVDMSTRQEFFESRNSSGQTPLHKACKTNDTKLVQLLLNLGAIITAKDELEKSVFQAAAGYGFKDLFQLLMDNLNTETEHILLHLDDQGQSLLHVTSANGSAEILSLLVHHPRYGKQICRLVNIVAKKDRQTALHLAGQNGHAKCVKILLQLEGIQSELREAKGSNALHLALQQTFNINKLIEEFLQHTPPSQSEEVFEGVDEATGQNCLHTAILKNFREVSLALIRDHRTPLSVATRDGGWSPLHLAVLTEDIEIAKALVSAGAILDMVDADGQTPLLQACLGRRLDMVRYFLDADANPAHQNKQAYSALHYLAAFCRDEHLLVNLIARGGDVNSKTLKLNTPMHFAAMNGNDVAAKVLLAHGANASATNEDKKSVMYLAKKWRHRSVEELVKPPDQSINITTRTGSASSTPKAEHAQLLNQSRRSIVHHAPVIGRATRLKAPILTTRSEESDMDSLYSFENEEMFQGAADTESGDAHPSQNRVFIGVKQSPTHLQAKNAAGERAAQSNTSLRQSSLSCGSPLPPLKEITQVTRRFLPGPVHIPWDLTVPAKAPPCNSDALADNSLQRKLKPSIRTNIGLLRDHLAHRQELHWPGQAKSRVSKE